jgi:tRNA 5-methylaminomethyl-2-thiouridine biosynthesis bifunctional protein
MKYKDNNSAPQLSWTDDGQPLSIVYNDVYYSANDGLAETDHVFINGNQLRARLKTLSDSDKFTIFECGFGTGLNFLRTWWHWHSVASEGQLHFISLEGCPLTKGQLRKALSQWQHEMPGQIEALLQAYDNLQPGLNRLEFNTDIRLDILVSDAKHLAEFDLAASSIDAIFMDGFSPARNPAMWQPELCRVLYQLARPGASLATYSVAGMVRRNLSAAGFSTQKIPGFGDKREMLTAYKAAN